MVKTPHIGRNINRLRELCGLKQETLAEEIGLSQQSVSKIEQSKNIDDAILQKIAGVLGLHADAIKNFNEDTLIYHIQKSTRKYPETSYNFNPLDKMVELYEALLKCERDKTKILEKLVAQMESALEQNKNQVMEAPMVVW